MIIALYGVAFAMTAVGLAALVQGYGIIMVERGWTFVIAGTVAATGGLILIGIAYAASRLNRLLAEAAKLRDRMGRLDVTVPERVPPRLAEPEAVPAPKPPGLVASERLREEAERAAARREPPLTEPPSLPPVVEAAAASEPVPGREEPRGEAAEASLTDETEPPLVGVPVPSRSDASESETAVETAEEEVVEPEREEAREPPAPTVVGTYNSGGNRYVMFSDGSIRAETPNGVFRFKSLDELKEFVASGGESAAGPESKAG